MTIANDIKIGHVIVYQKDMWRVVKAEHVKPGKGGAFMQLELKNLTAGTKTNVRFRSEESMEKVGFAEMPATFLYFDGDNAEFMDSASFEQISVKKSLIGEKIAFLKEEGVVKIAKAGDMVVDIVLPDNVAIEVVETQPYIRGQTITSSFKPATLANGVVVSVPQFIESGEMILVKPETLEYVERAKK